MGNLDSEARLAEIIRTASQRPHHSLMTPLTHVFLLESIPNNHFRLLICFLENLNTPWTLKHPLNLACMSEMYRLPIRPNPQSAHWILLLLNNSRLFSWNAFLSLLHHQFFSIYRRKNYCYQHINVKSLNLRNKNFPWPYSLSASASFFCSSYRKTLQSFPFVPSHFILNQF